MSGCIEDNYLYNRAHLVAIYLVSGSVMSGCIEDN